MHYYTYEFSNKEIFSKSILDIYTTDDIDPNKVTFDQIEKNIVRCPGQLAADLMIQRVEAFGKEGDFVTAPTISNLFSEIVTIWLISCWEKFGKPKNN